MNNQLQKFEFKLTDDNSVGFFWYAKLLEETNSKYQNLKIIKHPHFGKALLLDDYVMFTEYDEYKYHELISFPSLHVLNKCNDVLIVGGGDGLTAKRTLQFDVKNITLVEIDSAVIELSKKYFSSILKNTFNDPRLKVVVGDALNFLPSQQKYDLIMLDLQDPRDDDTPSQVLFSKDFYLNCKNSLNKNGILVAQISCPYLLPAHFHSQASILQSIFKHTIAYGDYMHCYGMHQYFMACSDDTELNGYEIREKISTEFQVFNF